jgi:uncharacterized protein (TIGR02271 family)
MSTTTRVTVVAVFSNVSKAEAAVSELASSGFASSDISLHSTEAAATHQERQATHQEGGIKAWFKSLFGSEEHTDEQRDYEEAFTSGNTIVAIDTAERDVERVADILNRHSPINVHEEAGGAAAGTAAGTSVGTRGGVGSAPPRQGGSGAREKESGSIPVVEEQLKVGKRVVVRGGARVYSRIVEEPVEETIRLREERVRIEREPANRPANDADLQSGRDQVIEVKEYAEEPVVSKQTRVVEEVRVGKDATEKTETVRDTVRNTEVNVENLNKETSRAASSSTDVDEEFRNDFASRYASSGEKYEAYEPAYRYGHAMANDPRYRGRDFGEVESDLRAEYRRQYPESAWDRIKESVRYGWNKVAGRTRSATGSR